MCAAQGDFCIVLYNPSSHLRKDYLKKAAEILLSVLSAETPCGIVKNISREGERSFICRLEDLKNADCDMFSVVFIGSTSTKKIGDFLVTLRGYKYDL